MYLIKTNKINKINIMHAAYSQINRRAKEQAKFSSNLPCLTMDTLLYKVASNSFSRLHAKQILKLQVTCTVNRYQVLTIWSELTAP